MLSNRRKGFTILEVLVALTASLLLMLGLARAYKFLGDRITTRQSELDLSGRLRDITFRLRDELRRATCDMSPPAKEASSEGYLVYHEGPFTDSTTILGSVPHPALNAASQNIGYFPDSRYGDIDDFLAFTSRAESDAPFVGFIPRGVLDAHRFASTSPEERVNITWGNPFELVPFYSQVAEIAYWLSPQWQRGADGALTYSGTDDVADGMGNFSLYPRYRDSDGDLLPDRMTLHRRVLLVRPDLNMTEAEMELANEAGNGSPTIPTLDAELLVPTVPILIANRIEPLWRVNANFPGITAPGPWTQSATSPDPLDTAAPHWMAGMARLQQFMDLSVSRVHKDWGDPYNVSDSSTYDYGMPTQLVKANSLAQLSRPENRFAHVQVPHRVISGTLGASMPQIALCPPHPYLMARSSSPPALLDPADPLVTGTTPTTFPSQADHNAAAAPGGSDPASPSRYRNVFGRFTMTTFLRPEFNLSDRVTDLGAFDPATVGAAAPTPVNVNRGGSDIIATDLVAFDIQVFDPTAPKFIWLGPNGVAGNGGDDDGNGTTDDASEAGWPETDDEYVSVNYPRLDEVFMNNGSRTSADWYVTPEIPFVIADRGDFVDVGYARLAGGPMRGLLQFDESGNAIGQRAVLDLASGASVNPFVSPFSGYNDPTSVTIDINGVAGFSTFPPSWEQSGRFVISSGGTAALSSFYQPVYDTWTDGYAGDRFDQEGGFFAETTGSITEEHALEVGASGTSTPPSYTESRSQQFNPANTMPGVVSAERTVAIRRWGPSDGAGNNRSSFVDEVAGSDETPLARSDAPIQITPPIPEPLRAIKITIRLNDPSADTVRQQTVIQEF